MRRRVRKNLGKKVNFAVIARGSELGQEPYRILDDVVSKHHSSLSDAAIAVAWRKDTKPDKDGKIVLGRCVKVTGLMRELIAFDFVIVLNREYWALFSVEQKTALIGHECCHAEVDYDNETGEVKLDERGRKCYRLRKHDIEEFTEIVQRHGCYKKDLELFAKAMQRKAKAPLFDNQPPEAAGDSAKVN